jgi:hypothetical protein
LYAAVRLYSLRFFKKNNRDDKTITLIRIESLANCNAGIPDIGLLFARCSIARAGKHLFVFSISWNICYVHRRRSTAAGGAALNDDNSYTTTALPFAFNYGGTTYPAGSTIGINSNGWIRVAGAVVASSYTVTSDASNFQTVAAFNRDLQEQRLATTTGTWTAGSTTMTVANAANFAVGMKLNGATTGNNTCWYSGRYYRNSNCGNYNYF